MTNTTATTANAVTADREAWLTEAAHLIFEERVAPHLITRDIAIMATERPFRVSVGFPSGKVSKVLAQCWRSGASEKGYNEIFVNPVVSDSLQILTALAHELVHYSDDCESGHKGHFARVARAIGLTGPLTAPTASDTLATYLTTIIHLLGEIPHAALDATKSGVKKQGTRMIKVECTDCGFSFRSTRTHVERLTSDSHCPACSAAALVVAN